MAGPQRAARWRPLRSRPAWPARPHDGRRRAVVAGRDLALTEAAAGALRRADYEVTTCSGWSGARGCSLLAQGTCDLVAEGDVVVDLFGVGSTRGLDLVEGLQAAYPHVPIVVAMDDDDRATHPGVADRVTPLDEPVDRRSLLEAVDAALSRLPVAAPVPSGQPAVAAKPRLRGLSHLLALGVSLVLGPALVAVAEAPHRLPAAVYAATLVGLFGCSALLHRNRWSARALPWVRRLDHSMIFVFIAGTYTPVVATALHGRWAQALLVAAWSGAAIGVGVTLLWLHAPRWVTSAAYLVVGWMAVAALPSLWSALAGWQLALLVLGGALYSAGAVVYARRRPDPWPSVFGYHEVFHALVVAAVTCHYWLVVALVT